MIERFLAFDKTISAKFFMTMFHEVMKTGTAKRTGGRPPAWLSLNWASANY
ncbi:hypothetical protein N181_16720 [Sinorhizobium fredii USDA 205]|nr:hypothetical protein N181_16720 [Sinorhizobium fredii USDA 205]